MGNRQSQACAAIFSGDRSVRLRKLKEQILLLLLRDSDSRVSDAKPDVTVAIVLIDIEGDGAVISEFACVAQQIKQDLSDFGDIRSHEAEVFRYVDLDLIAILCRRRLQGRGDFVDERQYLKILEVQPHLPGLNFR